MTCETYRTLLLDDVSNEGSGREHAAVCMDCAKFTREQQHLLSILARIRTEDALAEPEAGNRSARVEKNLLAEFRHLRETGRPEVLRRASSMGMSRREHEQPQGASALPMLTQVPQEASEASFRKWYALAAAVILASGVLLWISQRPQVPSLPNPPRLSQVTQLPRDWSVLKAQTASEDIRFTREVGRRSGTAGTEATAKTLSVDDFASAESAAASAVNSTPANSPTARRNLSALVAVASDTVPSSDEPFIQLGPGTPGFLDDGPVVMRVRMPYAAAAYLVASPDQLPRSGFVQADLLVGSDGTTRAIRFVQ